MNLIQSNIDCFKKEIQCLVILLASREQVLQSLIALKVAKTIYPQLEIHCLVTEINSEILKSIEWIHSVYVLDKKKYLKSNKLNEKLIEEFKIWIHSIMKSWDILINWSYSHSSCYLAGIIPANLKLGYFSKKNLKLNIPDGWSHYISSIMKNKFYQNIHWVDILTTQILTELKNYLSYPKFQKKLKLYGKDFFSSKETSLLKLFLEKKRPFLTLQLSSIKGSTSWNETDWSHLIDQLIHYNNYYNILLLCDQDQLSLLEKIKLNFKIDSNRIIYYIREEIDFLDYVEIIKKSETLFSSQHECISLASLLNTRVIHIGFHLQSFYQTAPYGTDHYLLEGKQIPSSWVFTTWLYTQTQQNDHRPEPLSEEMFHPLAKNLSSPPSLYRTYLRSPSQGGGMALEILYSKTTSLDLWSSQVMGQIARAWYCGWSPPIEVQLQRELIHLDLLKALRTLKEPLDKFKNFLEQALQETLKLYRKSQSLKSLKIMTLEDQIYLKQLQENIHQWDQQIQALAKQQTLLLPLAQILKTLEQQAKLNVLSESSLKLVKAYQQLKQGVGVFQEWVDYTFKVSRPQSIKSIARSPMSTLKID